MPMVKEKRRELFANESAAESFVSQKSETDKKQPNVKHPTNQVQQESQKRRPTKQL